MEVSQMARTRVRRRSNKSQAIRHGLLLEVLLIVAVLSFLRPELVNEVRQFLAKQQPTVEVTPVASPF